MKTCPGNTHTPPHNSVRTKENTTMKRKGTPARRQTGPASPAAQQFINTAARWRALPSPAKAAFNAANANYITPADPATPNRNSGYTFFVSVSSNLNILNAPPPVAPPASLSPPPPLPPMRLSITFGASLSMMLAPTVAVPAGNYAVYATPAVPIGNTTWKPRAYRKIGVITSAIPTGGVDIAQMYRSVYPQPLSSCQLSVKITPISSGGLHNVSLFVTGLTPLLSAVEASTDDADTQADGDLHLG